MLAIGRLNILSGLEHYAFAAETCTLISSAMQTHYSNEPLNEHISVLPTEIDLHVV